MTKTLDISIIVATSENNCIGINGGLPWNLPTDLKRFKELTLGNVVVMGRHTYTSIGHKLPDRINVVATRHGYFGKGHDILIDHDIWSQIDKWVLPVFIIGGVKIYKTGFKYATKLYLTRIHAEVEGDTFLKGFN